MPVFLLRAQDSGEPARAGRRIGKSDEDLPTMWGSESTDICFLLQVCGSA